MIKTFRHQGLRQLFETGRSNSISADLTRLTRRLDFLNHAASPTDMNLPGCRLDELIGERKGTWSVTVSGNWRLTFSFQDRNAFDVDLEDYH
ncbi:MAG: type II toxin-antitoxin system RelE/ParE family toxin [Acidobacteria bacterium]|nr:type II toxin-antitoxin system RelE/ParE family toxin [Acidobacteriota bacterium]